MAAVCSSIPSAVGRFEPEEPRGVRARGSERRDRRAPSAASTASALQPRRRSRVHGTTTACVPMISVMALVSGSFVGRREVDGFLGEGETLVERGGVDLLDRGKREDAGPGGRGRRSSSRSRARLSMPSRSSSAPPSMVDCQPRLLVSAAVARRSHVVGVRRRGGRLRGGCRGGRGRRPGAGRRRGRRGARRGGGGSPSAPEQVERPGEYQRTASAGASCSRAAAPAAAGVVDGLGGIGGAGGAGPSGARAHRRGRRVGRR